MQQIVNKMLTNEAKSVIIKTTKTKEIKTMKTYEVTARIKGIKRIAKTYIVHATSKTAAEAVARTQFAEEETENYNLICGCNWAFTAKTI